MKLTNLLVISGIILLAAISRLLPHVYNFSPLGAMALFGGAYFGRNALAVIVPVLAFWISDILVTNILYASYSPTFTWFYEGAIFTYLSIAFIALMGMFSLKQVNAMNLIGSSILASTIFFVVSNFGVWASGTMYPQNASGLAACYAAGLPFAWGTYVGDLFYCVALFGTYALLQKRMALAKA